MLIDLQLARALTRRRVDSELAGVQMENATA